MNPYGIGAALLLAAAAVWIHGHGRRASAWSREARGWPVTTGEVVSRRLELAPISRDDVTRHRYYWPVVAYRYRVEGVEYTCDRAFPAPRVEAMREPDARRLIERYPEGSPVAVSYCPGDPARACLLARDDVVGRTFKLAAATVLFAAALVAYVSAGT